MDKNAFYFELKAQNKILMFDVWYFKQFRADRESSRGVIFYCMRNFYLYIIIIHQPFIVCMRVVESCMAVVLEKLMNFRKKQQRKKY